jgi:hypothetical protein
MSPLMSSIYTYRLTQSDMVKKTPSNCSLLGSTPSSSGPPVTSYIYSVKSKTLMTGGWLGRSPTSASLIKKPPNSLHELRSYTKNSMRLVTPEPCPRNDWSSPVQPRRQPDSKTSQRRLACCPHTLVAKTTIDEDISSNWRVMLPALRMPGGYRSPCLM